MNEVTIHDLNPSNIMNTKSPLAVTRFAIWLLLFAATTYAMADVVYLTARPTPSGTGQNLDLNANFDPVYIEDNLVLGNTSARSVVADAPARDGSRYYASGTDLTNTTSGFTLKPDLATTGGIYLVEHSFRQFGNNSADVIMSVTSATSTLSFSQTDVFQQSKGDSTWQTLGYVTNAPGAAIPDVQFRYQSGVVNAGSNNRLVVDVFRFSEVVPCLDVVVPSVQGPLATNSAEVAVAGVTSNATAVAVYQDSGSGMVKLGEITTDVVEGVNLVPVAGLVKNAVVSASQTENGQESCIQASGILVGGGANPRIRVALSIRETSSTGPVGTPGSTASANLHFLGATFRNGSAPGDGLVVSPDNDWQTLTFDADPQVVLGNVSNVVGTINNFGEYAANDVVEIQVYALIFDLTVFADIYSLVGASSATVTSNGLFGVDWSWDAVPGAEGYRLLRSTNSAGFNEYVDVFSGTTYEDFGSFGWTPGNTVTPKAILQNGPSVQWNGVGANNTNNIGTTWGVLDAIAIAIDDLSDTGPFDLYIDNLQNGGTVFQDWEGFVAGAQDAAFRSPRFSGTTSGSLLAAPDQTIASNEAADTGTKSVRVQFQWNGTNDTKWVRLTTSGVGNPQVNLFEPISLRMLLLPVNSSPVAPAPPTLDIALINGEVVLNWEGAHTLLGATNAPGPYAPVEGPVILGPYTNAPAEDTQFFRLVN